MLTSAVFKFIFFETFLIKTEQFYKLLFLLIKWVATVKQIDKKLQFKGRQT